jgi:anti-anti-sigma factor
MESARSPSRSELTRPTYVVDGTALVHAQGEIDLKTELFFAEALRSALERGDSVVVDLSGTQYIDSTGINVLLQSREQADLVKRAFVLAAPSRLVRKIFGILEIGKRVSIYDTVEAALKDVRKPLAVHSNEDGS